MAKSEKKSNQDQEQEKKVSTAKKSTYSKQKKIKKNTPNSFYRICFGRD